MEKTRNRGHLISLHYLRGVAASLVVFTHLVLAYYKDNPDIGIQFPLETSLLGIPFFLKYVPMGMIAVTIFFLISGFVISASLDKESVPNFLITRLFRIYPTHGIAIALIAAGSAFSGNALSVTNVVASMGLINGFIGLAPVSLVMWSLIAEMHFYIVMAVVVFLFGEITLGRIVGLSAFVTAVVIGAGILSQTDNVLGHTPLIAHFSYNLTFMNFIFVGAIFWKCWNSHANWIEAFLAWVFVVSCAIISVYVFERFFTILGVLGPVGAGLILLMTSLIFLFALRVEPILSRDKLFLPHFLGDISYPLYLIHVPLGWWVMKNILARGVGYFAAVGCAIIACVFTAYCLHILIENPSRKFGKSLRVGKTSPSQYVLNNQLSKKI